MCPCVLSGLRRTASYSGGRWRDVCLFCREIDVVTLCGDRGSCHIILGRRRGRIPLYLLNDLAGEKGTALYTKGYRYLQ